MTTRPTSPLSGSVGDAVKVPICDFQVMLLCWFRYSLGRRTYMPSYCIKWLKKHWDILPYDYKRQIHSDINHAIEHDMAGADCDIAIWKEMLKFPIGEPTW